MCSTGRRRRGRDLFSALMRGTHETYNQNDSTTAPRPRVPTQRPTQKRPRPKRLATFHAVHYLSTSLRYRLRNCVRQFGQRARSAVLIVQHGAEARIVSADRAPQRRFVYSFTETCFCQLSMEKGVSAQSVWCHTHLHWINDVERTKTPKRTHDTSTAF